MQANCLVFPSPHRFNIQPILYNIVLISQNIEENYHIPYYKYLNLTSFNKEEDQFQSTLQRISNNSLSQNKNKNQVKNNDNGIFKTKEYIKYQNNRIGKKQSFQYQWLQENQNQFKKSKSGQFTTIQTIKMIDSNRIIKKSTIQSNIINDYVNSQEYIPCLFIPGKKNKIIVFFHANAQDISSSFQFLKMINNQTQYPILAMEYRGYSINKGQTNPNSITNDANRIIDYLLNRQIAGKQIIVFGRSIGCAISLSILKKYQIYSLILLSPFISLKKIAVQLYGNCAGWALKQGFNNSQNALNIKCPLLLIHGMKDNLVPYEHSLALFAQCKSYCQLKLIQTMTHSKFNFRKDFILHFEKFMRELYEQQLNQEQQKQRYKVEMG